MRWPGAGAFFASVQGCFAPALLHASEDDCGFIRASTLTLPSPASGRGKHEWKAVPQRRPCPSRWLAITLPRIIVPAISIVAVGVSASSSQPQKTPNSGTR